MASIDDIIAEVDHWFAEHIKKGPIAFEVNCYNQAHHALTELKDKLMALVTGKPPAAPQPVPAAAEPVEPAQAAEEDPSAAAESKTQPAA